VDGIISRLHLVGNYRFVFYGKNDGGSLFGATPNSNSETPEPSKSRHSRTTRKNAPRRLLLPPFHPPGYARVTRK